MTDVFFCFEVQNFTGTVLCMYILARGSLVSDTFPYTVPLCMCIYCAKLTKVGVFWATQFFDAPTAVLVLSELYLITVQVWFLKIL